MFRIGGPPLAGPSRTTIHIDDQQLTSTVELIDELIKSCSRGVSSQVDDLKPLVIKASGVAQSFPLVRVHTTRLAPQPW